ncbi:MAG TPA: hypothetical protein VLF59_00665 [Candidatus Saccharimonadales bacterium]|nr:hypothetical protein [Candidatus Saccharimonadales bacterium]
MSGAQQSTVHTAEIQILAMEPTDSILDRLARRIYLRQVDPVLLGLVGTSRINIRIAVKSDSMVYATEVMDHCDVRGLRITRLYLKILDFFPGAYIIVDIDEQNFKQPVQRYTKCASGDPDEIRALLLPQQSVQ